MTEKSCKTHRKGKTKAVNDKYYQILEEKILGFITSRNDETQRCDILEYIANDTDVHMERKNRSYEVSENENDTELYERMVDKVLERLIKKEKIKKIYYGPKKTRYTINAPTFTGLYNADIVIMQVEAGEEKRAKELIEANLEDDSIIIIPVEGYLLCTKMNSRKKRNNKSQSDYIRHYVHKAIRKAHCDIYSRK